MTNSDHTTTHKELTNRAVEYLQENDVSDVLDNAVKIEKTESLMTGTTTGYSVVINTSGGRFEYNPMNESITTMMNGDTMTHGTFESDKLEDKFQRMKSRLELMEGNR